MPTKTLSPTATDQINDHFGASLHYTFAGWSHSESFVWRATGKDRDAVYVKRHSAQFRYDRTMDAYATFAKELSCRVPEILFKEESELIVVFEEIPGKPLQDTVLTDEEDLAAYRRAGEIAREIHEVAYPGEQIDCAANAVEQMQIAMEEAVDLVDRKTLDWFAEIGLDANLFGDETTHYAHRDFSPRNWLVVPGDPESFGLIDFESARPDIKYADMWRMESAQWRERPARRNAFFEGYGRDLTDEESARFDHYVLRNLLTTVVWARNNNDPRFERWAREAITRKKTDWTR